MASLADLLTQLQGSGDFDAQMKRQIQATAMAGRPLTPEMEAYLASKAPEKEARSEALGTLGRELTGIPQAGRAATAIGEAVSDPTLANVTNAGANTALAAFRPLAAAKMLAAGAGVAGARDLGAFNMAADAQQPKGGAKTFPNLPPELNAEYLQLKDRSDRGRYRTLDERANMLSRMKQIQDLSNQMLLDDARAQNKGRQTQVEEEEARKTQAAKTKIAEDERAVKTAERLRDVELSRDRRFSDTELGKLWDKSAGLMPMAFGGLAGMLSRAATGPGTGGMKLVNNYALPLAAGGIAGSISYNTPLAYNAFFTEPDNPQKRAYEAYARELPPDHPRRSEWMDYASKLPDKNPVREVASQEFYDPQKMKERGLWGLVEGLGGGLMGTDVVRMPGRAISSMLGAKKASAAGDQLSAVQAQLSGMQDDFSRLSKALETRPANTTPALPPVSPPATSGQSGPLAIPPAIPAGQRQISSAASNQPRSFADILTTEDLARIVEQEASKPKGHWDLQPRDKGKFAGPPKPQKGDTP